MPDPTSDPTSDPTLWAARELVDESLAALRETVAGLDPGLLDRRPAGEDTNSIAVLTVHALNSARWWLNFATGAELPERDRDSEFRFTAGSADDLLSFFDRMWSDIRAALEVGTYEPGATRVDPGDGETLTFAWALLHGTEHLREHVAHAQLTRQVLETGERAVAANLFDEVWELLEMPDRSAAQDERMLHAAHASRLHWDAVGDAENLAIGEWQCARVYAVLGRAEPALHHAGRSLAICEEHGLGAFLRGAAYEALARASLVAGDASGAERYVELARAEAGRVTSAEDLEVLQGDLASLPGAAGP